MLGMALVAGIIVLWFTGYGMAHADQTILHEVWELSKLTAIVVGTWAGGKAFSR